MPTGPHLTLASASPRRLVLLAQIGVTPTRVVSPEVDETPLKAEPPRDYVRRIAAAKARAVAEGAVPHAADEIILAGDTSIAAGRRILGKPTDAADARRMLGLLSGRRHHCLSAVAVIGPDGRLRTRLSDTIVAFRPIAPAELDAYLANDEWQGKAGAYAIQGRAEAWVRFIHGSYSGVVGLPLFETRALLAASGYVFA